MFALLAPLTRLHVLLLFPTLPCAVVSQSKLNSNPIIAAIPLMLLTLLTAAVGGYTFVHRQMMWPYHIGRADVARLEAMASKPALVVGNGTAAASRVGVLTFENLTVR